MKTLLTFVSSHRILSAFIVVVAVSGVVYVAFDTGNGDFDSSTAVVGRRDLSQEVNITGKVRATESIDLAFEKGGRVAALYVDVGDSVTAGSVLVSLESAELRAQLLQAEASVKAEEAKLAKLVEGTRPEELLIAKTKVKNAETSLANSKNSLENTLQDAFTKSDDAIRDKVDQVFSNPNSSNPQLLFTSSNSQLENEVRQERVTIGPLLSEWGGSSSLPFETRVSLTRNNIILVKAFLDKVAALVNPLVVSGSLTQTTLDGWRTGISTARTNVNTASTNFIAAEGNYQNAQSALILVQQELALKKAGSIPYEIATQEAVLDQARANVANLEAQLSKTSLRAPFAGLVTKRDIKVGEIATAGVSALSLISDGSFEIIANIPEADIAKVVLGVSARVSLDAYGDGVPFSATVTEIDPAETIIDGVSTYQVTFNFSENDQRIRSGMTADLDIVTSERKDVLAIPSRLVFQENGERVAYVITVDGSIERRPVTTGVRGFDGYVEVLSGLFEGERVVPKP